MNYVEIFIFECVREKSVLSEITARTLYYGNILT